MIHTFFPSWKFFDQVDDPPLVFFRVRFQSEVWGEWKPIQAPSPISRLHRFAALFINPKGNLFLAGASLVNQVLNEISECSEPDNLKVDTLVSYHLLKRWVLWQIFRQTQGHQRFDEYQFKIASLLNSGEWEETVLSTPETIP